MKTLALETRTARVAAVLDARPQLGVLWRRMVGLSEAAASLSLEDVTVLEQDILRPDLGLGQGSSSPQATRVARAIYLSLLRPMSISQTPDDALAKCLDAARMTDLVDEDLGGRVSYPDIGDPAEISYRKRIFAEVAPQIVNHEAPVVLRAIAITTLASELMPEPNPAAERLLFMHAEHEIRANTVFSDPIVSHSVDGLESNADAFWVMTPSLALSRGGFRAWSPRTDLGYSNLVDRLTATIGREIGHLGPLLFWQERLQTEFRGFNQKSRRKDLADFLIRTPIFYTSTVSEALGISDRSARTLVDDAALMNLIVPLANRRSYRLWAVPAFAEMIKDRRSTRLAPRAADTEETSPEPPQVSRLQDDDFEQRVANALADLDAAMAHADATMLKYRRDPTN